MGDLRVGYINLDNYQTPQDTRLYAQAAFMPSPNGPLVVRTGLLGTRDAATLTGATNMQADVDPFVGIIAGTESGDQGTYPVALKAQKRVTFGAGESAIDRIDRVIAHVYDNDADGGGLYDGEVEVLPGDSATGAATALPADSMLMWEVTVPAGASAGGSGIPWASAVADKRQWTTTAGGALPVPDKAARDSIVAPHEGFAVFRIDLGVIETWDGAVWRTQGVPTLDSDAELTALDQYEGQLAVIAGDVYRRHSGSWTAQPRGLIAAKQDYRNWPAGQDNGIVDALTVVGANYGGSGATTPMTFTATLDPDRCYKLDAWMDAIDSNSGESIARVWIKRAAVGDDILAGITVGLAYSYVAAQTFGTGSGTHPCGFVSGLSGDWQFGLLIERYLTGGLLRIGGHYYLSLTDVGPASALLVNQS